MINDIAKDLGNTSFNGFTTNKFGAGELNNITKSLVTKGVLTSGNACVPIVVDGKLYIQLGTIVFDNGAKKVLATSEEVEYLNNSVVYALNNVSAGTCSLVVSNSFPETGDYVKLATVDGSGNVTDIREIATSKMALYGGNNEVIKEWNSTILNVLPVKISSFTKKDFKRFKYIMSQIGWRGMCYKISDITYGEKYYAIEGQFYISFAENGNNIDIYGNYRSGSSEDKKSLSGTFTLI